MENEVLYDREKLFSKRLVSATLDELVAKALYDRSDRNFLYQFIIAYRILATPKQLLDIILRFYNNAEKQKLFWNDNKLNPVEIASITKINLANFIGEWMIVGFYDFEDNPELLVQIKELANRDPKSSFANLIKESIETLSTNKARKEKNRILPEGTKSIDPPQLLNILSGTLSAEFIAQQLTLMEYDIIRNIRYQDLFNSNALDDELAKTTLLFYFTHFHNIREFFIAEISSLKNTPKACAKAITRAIQIAELANSYKNYNTVMEFLYVLCNPSILAIEKAWDIVDGKVFKILEELVAQMSSDNNYANYRELLNKITTEAKVPFLDTHLGEIRFIKDFFQTKIENEFNVEKIRSLGEEVHKFTNNYMSEYNFTADLPFRKKLIDNFQLIEELSKSKIMCTDNLQLPEKLAELKTKYNKFFGNILNREQFNFYNYNLSKRDWIVLSINETVKKFQAGELIEGGDDEISMLKEGSLELEKDGIRFKSMKSPCIINAAPLIGRKNSYLVYAKTECEISFIKKQLLLSVIESDNNLCVKFCSHLAFQLIEQLHDFNLLSINHMNQLFLNQFGSVKVPAEKAKNRKDVNRLRRNPVEPPLPVSGKVVLQKQKSHMVIKLTSSLSAEIRLDPKHRRDVEFRDLFQLPNDEFLLKEYKVALWNVTVYTPATLFISQHFVGIYSKLFTHKLKVEFHSSLLFHPAIQEAMNLPLKANQRFYSIFMKLDPSQKRRIRSSSARLRKRR